MIDEWTDWQLILVELRLLLGRSTVGALEAGRPSAPMLLIRGGRESFGHDIQRLCTILDCGHVSDLEQPADFQPRGEGVSERRRSTRKYR